MRFLLFALMAMAIAACDLGATSPSAEPLPSVGMESAAQSMSADSSASTDASASADASGETGMTCEDAFASLGLADISTMAELDAASDALDETIAACADVSEWQAELSALAPSIDLDGVEAFLAARCDTSDLLSDVPICEELDT